MKLLGWLRRGLPAPVPHAGLVDLTERSGEAWVPTHRHRSGGLYRLLTHGINEADRSAVAIYDDASGTVWVRNAAEFGDGRFTPVLENQAKANSAATR